MTRSLLLALSGLVLAVLLTGCPYQSEVPLDSPVPVDSRLFGTWSEDATPPTTKYTVTPAGESEYRVQAENTSGTVSYLAHLSSVAGRSYLNLKEQAAGSSYLLFLCEFAEDGASFTLRPLTENITEKFTDSASLRDFVEKYQDLSFFFESPTRYLRTVSP